MTTIVTVAALKAHLRIDHDAEDSLLADYLAAAQAHVEAFVGAPLAEPADPDLAQAIKLLAGHWYANREASFADGTARPIPLGFADLLGPHRSFVF
jgi:uncharacterized phage protein (predicted DNA packaging)